MMRAEAVPAAKDVVAQAVLNTMEAPRFSGHDCDWEPFAKAWGRYIQMLREANGEDLPDSWLFQMLEKSLDETSQLGLRAVREQGSHVGFQEFWRELERTYGRDTAEKHRRTWEQLSLTHVTNLTVYEWRNFYANFQFVKGQVGDVTEEESQRRFLQAMPFDHQEKVQLENLKRAKKQHWVRVRKPCPLRVSELEEWATEFMDMARRPRVDDSPGAYFLECGSEYARDAILDCNGLTIRGMTLDIVAECRRMSCEEMYHWVLDKLRVQEELQQAKLAQVGV